MTGPSDLCARGSPSPPAGTLWGGVAGDAPGNGDPREHWRQSSCRLGTPHLPWYSIKRQLLGDENSSQGPEQGWGWWDSRPRVRTGSLIGNNYHGTRERGWMTHVSPEKTWGGPRLPLPSPGGMSLTSGGTESSGCFGTTAPQRSPDMVLNPLKLYPKRCLLRHTQVFFWREAPMGFTGSSEGSMSSGQELRKRRNAPCRSTPSPKAACPILDNAERGKIIN